MKYTYLVLVLTIASCSSAVSDRPGFVMREVTAGAPTERAIREVQVGARIVVLPFENYTETPLAGHRVASIVEGVAVSKGYRLVRANLNLQPKEYTEREILDMVRSIRDADFVITGKVNEFRYKAGIDGEPAVSITLVIYPAGETRPVYVATQSRSGWYYQSISTLAQGIIRELLPNARLR